MVTIQFSYNDDSVLNCEAILVLINALFSLPKQIKTMDDSIPSTIGASRMIVYFTHCVSQVSARGFHLFCMYYALCYFIVIVQHMDYIRAEEDGGKASQLHNAQERQRHWAGEQPFSALYLFQLLIHLHKLVRISSFSFLICDKDCLAELSIWSMTAQYLCEWQGLDLGPHGYKEITIPTKPSAHYSCIRLFRLPIKRFCSHVWTSRQTSIRL